MIYVMPELGYGGNHCIEVTHCRVDVGVMALDVGWRC